MEDQKKVFITGASRGIGKSLAQQYSENSDVFLFARNEIALSEICDELKSKGRNAHYFAGDIGDRNDVGKAIEMAKDTMGGIDIAILNAGISDHMNIREFSSDTFEKHFRINVLGNAYAFEFLIPVMKAKGGVIAGVSSIADFRGMPGSSPYSSSKIAFTYLLEAARIELRAVNIRVVTIRFGFIQTDMIKKNDFYMPFILSPDICARRIIRGIAKGKDVISFPKLMVWLTAITRLLPGKLYEKILRFRVRG